MKFLLILTFSFFSLSAENSIKRRNVLIEWNQGRTLQWKDFQGTPPVVSKSSAVSLIKFEVFYKLNGNGDHLKKYKVKCFFDKSRSWVKDTSAHLLSHEQTHFNIGEMVARRLRKRLYEIKRNDSITSEFGMHVLVREYEHLHSSVHGLYDEHTNSSMNISEQFNWKRRINAELDSLKMFQ